MTDLTTATASELTSDTPIMAFAQLQLAAPLARAVAEMGYETMTPIQAQAIPVVLQGRDVMGAAQTGTGKTAAFALPLMQRMLKHENASTSPARHPVRALVPVSWPFKWPNRLSCTASTPICAARWCSAAWT